MEIEGAATIVVGGASGLGEATVRALSARGAVITIADVNAEKGQALGEELEADFVACDVREETQVEEAVARAAKADGGLRIAVCCAGTGWAQKVAGSKGPHPLLPFETIIQINLIGTFNVLRYAAAAMIETEPTEDGERGACVNTASIAAFDGQVGQIAYSASKGGVVAMTSMRSTKTVRLVDAILRIALPGRNPDAISFWRSNTKYAAPRPTTGRHDGTLICNRKSSAMRSTSASTFFCSPRA